MVDPVADVTKRRTEAREPDDRKAHPLRKRETDGVAPEMVAQPVQDL